MTTYSVPQVTPFSDVALRIVRLLGEGRRIYQDSHDPEPLKAAIVEARQMCDGELKIAVQAGAVTASDAAVIVKQLDTVEASMANLYKIVHDPI
jgi:hypothetical protein